MIDYRPAMAMVYNEGNAVLPAVEPSPCRVAILRYAWKQAKPHWRSEPSWSAVRRVLCTVGMLIVLSIVFSATAPADDADRQATFNNQLLPLLRTYCYDCHGQSDGEGDVSLAQFRSADDFRTHRDLWLRTLRQVQAAAMPPADADPMDSATRAKMVQLIDSLTNSVDCVQHPNPGRVTLRRLNRAEYRNTVQDLLGVDYQPAANFPGDDVGYGFDNIGDVLSLPPLLMEKYLTAAEAIAGQAIVTPPPPRLYRFDKRAVNATGADRYRSRDGRLTMTSHGTVSVRPEITFVGSYKLILTAGGSQGGDEPVRVQVKLGDKEVGVIDVPSEEGQDYELSLRLPPGKRELSFTFINDFYDPKNGIDRNLDLYHIHIEGIERRRSTVTSEEIPASHKAILFVEPGPKRTADEASAQVLTRLASRAFRRPATAAETRRLQSLAAEVRRDGGTFEESIQVALQAILVSPHFLFKVEKPQPYAEGQPAPKVSQYELATRISYFLWSSMPDDELLLMAHRGQLSDADRLRKKIASMLRDRRSNALVENFASQWLQLRNLEAAEPDDRQFPAFNDQIRRLMQRETLTFFAAVMRQNRPLTTLLDGEFTFLNEELAAYYQIPGVRGEQFREVSLQDSPRAGLLTHGSVLVVTSNPTRTSPVKRGKWILDNLLNMPPPPAPPNVPELSKAELSGSLRERMEQHRANPACAACHRMMDPLGFALENFDAAGRWRARDGGTPINARGELPDGTVFDGVEQLRGVLSERQREAFVRCMIEKMLTYAVGRGVEYYDRCAVDEIYALLRANDYRFAFLVAGIIESDPFQKQGERE
ncbi:DUF1592 domain-containing protein [Roseimaritima ulvae]|uniref:Planctomycete cytochrome C n=1 Tax=Roseimaritima ulvae TaxID=980254 RepID=A0A5B9QQS5_9BACT|nr:DUF1592 domain-containing protein [Roseimaritima ulvae]QEG40000.1 hypothetical protein UC8_20040 [Roseimaritima ulvae]